MQMHAHKLQENKSQAVANTPLQNEVGQMSSFVVADTGREAMGGGKPKEGVNNSPFVLPLQFSAAPANNNALVKQLRAHQLKADNYAAKPAQLNQTRVEAPPPARFVPPVLQKGAGLQTKTIAPFSPAQNKANNTGLPDKLKSGIEHFGGYDMGDVKVNYNSAKPAQLQAYAFAQGANIHVAPGQEKHLPHEAWHVVQQKQGRVAATAQLKGGAPVNDDEGLEHEADIMGARSLAFETLPATAQGALLTVNTIGSAPVQRVIDVTYAEYIANTAVNRTDKNRIKTYLTHFVKADYDLAKQYFDTDAGDADIETQYNQIYTDLAADADVAALRIKVETLVTGINAVLTRQAFENHDHKYDRGNAGNWADHATALESWEKTVTENALPNGVNARIMHAGLPDALQTVNFTDINTKIPKTLSALILDIYFKLRAGGILDSRNAAERLARSVTVDKPGAIRSWHEDSRGKLPANNFDAANIPPAKVALHNHYAGTSNAGGGAGAGAAVAPSGFIEYTGTGIQGDAHNSKIIVDYINNHVYLTLSHYQYWGKQQNGAYGNLSQGHNEAEQQNAETIHSAYTKIIMDV